MKTIGIIGGMSWESSVEYYRIINEEVKNRLGGLRSAKIILFSVDFAEIEILQHEGKWAAAGVIMANAASALERAGADLIIIATNTMHKLANYVTTAVQIPLLHIADATAEMVVKTRKTKVGLLGTQYTMEQDFYKGRLIDNYNLEVIVPDLTERKIIHNIIYDELCQGIIKEESKANYLRIIKNLMDAGAQAVILGCTEIELLIKPDDCTIPLFPTAKIHALAAVDYVLN